MTQGVELLASYWTISAGLPHTDREYSPFDFKDRVQSAAIAGFKGFGIWHADLEHVLEKYSLKEMKQILGDNGIRYVELEFLTDWFLEGERKKVSDIRKQNLFEAAQMLSARHIKVGDFFQEQCSLPHLIDAFAALCGEAAEHGTRIGFELMPFAMIRTLKEALAMVKGAGAPNGGIVLDLWQVVKLGIPYEEVFRVPSEYVVGVELNDGTLHSPWSLHEDTIHHRRFCGEGEFDVRAFVQGMQNAGYTGPWGIEVLSAELRPRPLDELTARAFQTTMAQFS
ncbi:MAG: sugar phosphate isomerase/epimerase family protein [Terriglobales bacterium]